MPVIHRWPIVVILMIVLGLTAASAAVTAQDQFEPRDSREQAAQIKSGIQTSMG
jgi:hypothetical protein